jgi:hypothetical protein
VPLPPLTEIGDLPLGVHRASLREVRDRFGTGSRQRMAVADRLDRIYQLAHGTGHLVRSWYSVRSSPTNRTQTIWTCS